MAFETVLAVKIDPRGAETGARRVEQSLRRMESRADRATSAIASGARRLGGAFDSVRRAVFSLRTAFAAIGAGLLAREFLQAAVATENVRVQLKFLTGSTQDAAKAFELMRTFAAKVPFEFEQIQAASANLLVVARDMTEFGELMEITGDIAAATGLSFQQTASQLQRAIASSLSAAELFRERGVTQLLGFNSAIVNTGDFVREKLIKDWREGTNAMIGATREMAKTWTGTMSMLSDQWFAFRVNVMDESGLFDFLKGNFEELRQIINENFGSIEEFGVMVGESIIEVTEKVLIGSARVIDFMQPLTNAVIGVANSAIDIFMGLPDWAKQLGVLGAILIGPKLTIALAGLFALADQLNVKVTQVLLDAGVPIDVVRFLADPTGAIGLSDPAVIDRILPKDKPPPRIVIGERTIAEIPGMTATVPLFANEFENGLAGVRAQIRAEADIGETAAEAGDVLSIERIEKSTQAYGAAETAVRSYLDEVHKTVETMNEASETTEKLTKSTDKLLTGVLTADEAFKAEAASLEAALKVQKDMAKGIDELVKEYETMTESLTMTESELELAEAKQRLFNIAVEEMWSPDDIARLEAAVAAYNNQREAVDAAAVATENLQKQQEEAAREADRLAKAAMEPFIRAAENVQSAVGDIFFDLFAGIEQDGKSIWQRIADVALSVFRRLAAELASIFIIQDILAPIVQSFGFNQLATVLNPTGGGGILNLLSLGGQQTGGFGLSSFLPAGLTGGINSFGASLFGLGFGGMAGAASAGAISAATFGGAAASTGAISAMASGGAAGASLSGLAGPSLSAMLGPIGLAIGAGLIGLSLFGGGLFGPTEAHIGAGGRVGSKGGSPFIRGFSGKGVDTADVESFANDMIKIIERIQEMSELLGFALQTVGGLRIIINPDDPASSNAPGILIGPKGQELQFGLQDREFATVTAVNLFLRNTIARIEAGAEGGEFESETLKELVLSKKRPKARTVSEFLEDVGLALFIDEIQAGLPDLTDAAEAIKALNREFDKMIERAEFLRLSQGPDILEAERQRLLEQMTTDFNQFISDSILAIEDPGALALLQLERRQEEMLRNAEDLGANLSELERLFGLERQQLLEQSLRAQNASIRAFIIELTSGPSSPLNPQDRLANAEAEFERVRAEALGGGAFNSQELLTAASNLINISRVTFASSEAFFERFNFIVATLESILDQAGEGVFGDDEESLQGFGHGGEFVVPGSGGIDSVVVPIRATPGEVVSFQAAGAGSLGDLAQINLRGFDDLVSEVQGLRREVVALRVENVKLRRTQEQAQIA